MRAIIIGAGAAGVAAARVLGAQALVLEAASAPLCKLRISGGGRCNLSNANLEPGRYAGCAEYFAAVMGAASGRELVQRFGGCGWRKIRDEQFFAKSADEVARRLLANCGARVIYDCSVQSVRAASGGWLVGSNLGEFFAEVVVVASGSRAGVPSERGRGAKTPAKTPAPETAAATAGENPLFSQKATKTPAPSENPLFSQKPVQIPAPSENPVFSQKPVQIPAKTPAPETAAATAGQNPLFSQKAARLPSLSQAQLPANPRKLLRASDIALQIARENALAARDFAPALCELFLQPQQAAFAELAGLSLRARLSIAQPAPAAGDAQKSPHFLRRGGELCIDNELLFTHRGLGGPAGYAASLWWQRGALVADFSPAQPLKALRSSRKELASALNLPKRFCAALLRFCALPAKPLAAYSAAEFSRLEQAVHGFAFAVAGRAPLARAEVATGGVHALACLATEGSFRADGSLARGLFFAGEAVDFTGALGGFNLTHAILSGERAGKLAAKLLEKPQNGAKIAQIQHREQNETK